MRNGSKNNLICWACLGVISTWAPLAAAIEIQLKPECAVSNTIVTLGDVAVFVGDRDMALRLSRVELFPSPPKGGSKRIKRSVVEKGLSLRGLNSPEMRITGASSIVVRRSSSVFLPEGPTIRSAIRPASAITGSANSPRYTFPASHRQTSGSTLGRYQRTMARQAGTRVERAIHNYLSEQRAESQWSVDVALAEHIAEHIPKRVDAIRVTGGRAPWTGEQQFTITFDNGGRSAQVPVIAKISLPPMIVASTRRISRGEVIRAVDLKMVRAMQTNRSSTSLVTSFDDIVGREATRVLVENSPIARSSVQLPILVKQRENLVVFARTPGIVIRSFGIAQQSGRKNDIIRVEPANQPRGSREYFMARVTGVRQVELLASGAEYESQRKGHETDRTRNRQANQANTRPAFNR